VIGLLEAHLQRKERRLLLEVLEEAAHCGPALCELRGGSGSDLVARLGLSQDHFRLGELAQELGDLREGNLGGNVERGRELLDEAINLAAADEMADELADAAHVELALGGGRGVQEVALEHQRLPRHLPICRRLARKELRPLDAFLERLAIRLGHAGPEA